MQEPKIFMHALYIISEEYDKLYRSYLLLIVTVNWGIRTTKLVCNNWPEPIPTPGITRYNHTQEATRKIAHNYI